MDDYVWHLSRSANPDAMNTSFGPRINTNRWDFHDGIDLPGSIGTEVYAVRDGIVYLAGPAHTGGFTSRHVVVETHDPSDGLMYIVYLHLDSIDEAVVISEGVRQGQLLGTVGADGATYPHLHLEFRKGTPLALKQTVVHPLGYLPYADTPNFTPPLADRFNRFGTQMAARLLFGASSKLEGDLLRVEVELSSGENLIENRIVDFNDKTTINKTRGNSDTKIYTNDIGVEGYQKSNMVAMGRMDLHYGILVRRIPTECDFLIARVIDVGGHSTSSGTISIPNRHLTNEMVDFEDGAMPPGGWTLINRASGEGTTVSNDASAAHVGKRGMLCTDNSTSEERPQAAGIQYALPAGRFEWVAEGWFRPTALGLTEGQSVYLLHFLSGTNLSVAARIHNRAGSLRAGIVAKPPSGTLRNKDSAEVVATGVWCMWRLHIQRIGTRETTATLYLKRGQKMLERARLNWDSTIFEPLSFRAGIGLSSAGATATVHCDDIRISEFK
jgi:hypothetical protein